MADSEQLEYLSLALRSTFETIIMKTLIVFQSQITLTHWPQEALNENLGE